MTNRGALALILLLNVCSFLYGQQKVNGKIYSITDSVIPVAAVFNKNLKLPVYSGKDGSYSILAAEGDTLIFSAVGFAPDTITVRFHMLLTPFDVTLQRRIITLETVKLTSSYREDSLKRRGYYSEIYKTQTPYRPDNGFGISFSPISSMSKEARQKRTLKQRLLKEEQDDYIDRSFPVEWVSQLTGLKGDSLSLFMYRYRPSYDFCRKSDRQGMLLYINDKLKEFRKPKRTG
ncbi:MAG: hypothetical protein Q8941_13630 [Bacteroidota bacterium]|nr:hypothetical protein [Bacteroidota bacterium]